MIIEFDICIHDSVYQCQHQLKIILVLIPLSQTASKLQINYITLIIFFNMNYNDDYTTSIT